MCHAVFNTNRWVKSTRHFINIEYQFEGFTANYANSENANFLPFTISLFSIPDFV